MLKTCSSKSCRIRTIPKDDWYVNEKRTSVVEKQKKKHATTETFYLNFQRDTPGKFLSDVGDESLVLFTRERDHSTLLITYPEISSRL